MQKAEAAHAPAVAKLQRERQKATQEHGAKLGLFQAIAERDALHRQTSTVFDSVVTAFKGSSEYKSAAEAAAKASEQLKAVREDESLAEAKKAQLTSEHSATIRRPAELERARLDADPKLLEARQREGEAAKKVAALQPQVTKAVESDPDVVAALKHEREAAPASPRPAKTSLTRKRTRHRPSHPRPRNQAARRRPAEKREEAEEVRLVSPPTIRGKDGS